MLPFKNYIIFFKGTEVLFAAIAQGFTLTAVNAKQDKNKTSLCLKTFFGR